jgi:unsaturated rhamnogalacturonyl hydrolase
MVESVIARAPSVLTDKWEYDTGLVLKGIERVALKTKNTAALAYVKRTIDGLIDKSGTIKGYRTDEYNIDQINMGRVLFRLWAEAQGKDKVRYREAIETLRSQMRTHPRTEDGAFWHKKIYPHQMWLDGVYMASPFLAEYAATFPRARTLRRCRQANPAGRGAHARRQDGPALPRLGRAAPRALGRCQDRQVAAILGTRHGLVRHGRGRRARLAAPRTSAKAGCSCRPGAARSRDCARAGSRHRRLVAGARPAGTTGELPRVLGLQHVRVRLVQGGTQRLARQGGVQQGRVARLPGLLARVHRFDANGHLNLKNVCKVAGLGGNPYRDGSYAYYTSTDVVKNDAKGVGAFIWPLGYAVETE